jgi:hypothetical protein
MTTTDHDDEIRAAYERLTNSLDAPRSVPWDVERRVRHRRVRRVGAAIAFVLVAGAAGAVATLGGGDRPSEVAVDEPPTGPTSTLTFERPDGTSYTFEDLSVTCDPTEARAVGAAPRVWALSPIELDGDTPAMPFVWIEARLDMLTDGQVLTLPLDDRNADRALTLFFVDTEGTGPADDPFNELSSGQPDASGTVQVLRATCDPTPTLELKVDAVLGSEVEQSALPLRGELVPNP